MNDLSINQMESFEIGSARFADHLPLTIRLNIPTTITRSNSNNVPRLVWRVHDVPDRWKQALPQTVDTHTAANSSLQRWLAQLQSSRRYSQSQAQRLIQHCWSLLLSTLTAAMTSLIKRTRRTEYNYHWYSDADVREQHKRVCDARQRWRRHRHDRSSEKYLVAYLQQQKAFRSAASKARAAALQNLYESIMPGPASPLLWSALARLRVSKGHSHVGSIPNHDGSLPSTPVQALDNLSST